MTDILILGALVGLVGAVENNGKSSTTDMVIKEALQSNDVTYMLEVIHNETFKISPSCKNCTTPCGKTSDANLNYLNEDEDLISSLKRRIVNELVAYIKRSKSDVLEEIVYKSIAYLGYNLRPESYEEVLTQLRNL